jgi:hypothetical protein
MKSTGALLAALMALGVVSGAHAQTASASSGLGQAWPNAADVSANPNWHVYVFQLNGIKYVQVNDLNGAVHAAVGTVGGTAFVLPIGVDAQNVTTTPTTSSSAVTVYQDATTTITATPQSNGTTTMAVEDTCTAYTCSALTKAVPTN